MERISVAHRYRLALTGLIVALAVGQAATQGSGSYTVTIVWDPNPEPTVVGYYVYVGTRSGDYRETFNVTSTTFTYRNPASERTRYYLAVAAYAAGPIVGQRSAEVSIRLDASPSEPDPVDPRELETLLPTSRRAEPPAQEPGVVCPESRPVDCFLRRTLARGLGAVTALSAVSDSLLFAIEEGSRVLALDNDSLVPRPALIVDRAGTRFTDLVADPGFQRTGYVFVGVSEQQTDGTREFRIVRYRAVQHTLGEPAVVVSPLLVWGADTPKFTIDQAGHLYVAMPATDAPPSDTYAGRILRFNVDGSVPSDNLSASPILARGYSTPTALSWDGRDLWMAGIDRYWPYGIARLRPETVAEGARPWAPGGSGVAMGHVLSAAFLPTDASSLVLEPVSWSGSGPFAFVDDSHRFYRATAGDSGSPARLETMAWAEGEIPVVIAAGRRRELFVAVRSADGTHAIVELVNVP